MRSASLSIVRGPSKRRAITALNIPLHRNAALPVTEQISTGLRSAIRDGYFSVDHAIVWQTIQTDLPALRSQIAALPSV